MTESKPFEKSLPRVVFFVLAGGLVVLSLLPASYTPPTFGISDKLQHGMVYLVLAFAAAWAYPGSKPWSRLTLPLVALGALLELGQYFVPGRYPEVADILANLAGIILGIAVHRAFARRRGPG